MNQNLLKQKNKAYLLKILLIMIISIATSKSATCPSTVTDLASTTFTKDRFNSPYSTEIMGLLSGQVSENLYLLYSLKNIFSLDKSEQNIYLAEQNLLGDINFPANCIMVSKLNCTDGSIVSTQSHTDCYSLSSYSSDPQGQLKINDNQFFFLFLDGTNNNIVYAKATFGQGLTDWMNTMSCNSNSNNCDSIQSSASLLSNDGSTIYSFAILGPLNSLGGSYSASLYLMALSSNNGSVIGARYKSSRPCIFINDAIMYGDLIIAPILCQGFDIIIYNTQASTFIIKNIRYIAANGVCIEKPSQRLVIVGRDYKGGIIHKLMLDSIDYQSEFQSVNWNMTELPAGTNDVTPITNDAVTSASPLSVAAISVTNQTVTYSLIKSNSSDVYMRSSDQLISVAQNSNLQVTPNLTCSISGATAISYSLESYSGSQVPSWVAIDKNSGQLSISAPEINAITTFRFYINSAVSGTINSVQKLIILTVTLCNIDNCRTCSNINGSTCDTCNSGYYLSNGQCAPLLSTSQGLSASTQLVTGAAACAAVISSMMSASSLSSIYSLVSQLQLFFFLLLTRAFIPQDVSIVITGSKFIFNPLELVSFKDIKLYNTIVSGFDYGLSNNLVEPLNIESDSSVYNASSFLTFLLIFVITHYFLVLLNKLLDKYTFEGKLKRITDLVKFLIDKALKIMTYAYYIRYFLGMHQFLLIVSMYELYNNDTSQDVKQLSYFFALALFSFCTFLITLVGYLSLSSYQVVEEQHNKIGELFAGVKMDKIRKLYVCIMLLRRAVFVILLISLMSIPSRILICTLVAIQVVYTAFVFVVRPFIEHKNNIIECINETYFSILLITLIFLNNEGDWNHTYISICVYFISSNSIVAFIIILADTIRVVVSRIKKCLKTQENQNQIVPQLEPANVFRDNIRRAFGSEDHDLTIQDTSIIQNNRRLYEESKVVDFGDSFQMEFRRSSLFNDQRKQSSES